MKKFAAACIIATIVVLIYPNMESNTLIVSAHSGHSAHLHEHGVCPYAESSVSGNSVSANAVDESNNTNIYTGRHGRHNSHNSHNRHQGRTCR